MEKFIKHTGKVALIDRGNIDTDQIIPKQFLKSIKKTGYGESLFFDWRYLEDGSDNPDFELNQKQASGASILVAGNNFGCGSSREHAVWAVKQYGLAVVIAPRVEVDGEVIPGFADIFRNNSVKNGLLTIELSEAEVETIKSVLAENPELTAEINLEVQKITLNDSNKTVIPFQYDESAKQRLVEGLDDIGLTLKFENEIYGFENQHQAQMYSN